MDIKRGSIHWCNLGRDKLRGEQGGIRPVVILQNDIGNRFSPVVTICPITSKIDKMKKVPTHVAIHTNVMKNESVALLEQITTISKERIGDYIGSLDEITMRRIENAGDIQLGRQRIKGIKDNIFKIRMDKEIRFTIIDLLQDIQGLERNLYNAKKSMIRRALTEHREYLLEELENYCNLNNLNYEDFYIRYNKKEYENELSMVK